jgi:hypothetical protein
MTFRLRECRLNKGRQTERHNSWIPLLLRRTSRLLNFISGGPFDGAQGKFAREDGMGTVYDIQVVPVCNKALKKYSDDPEGV